MDSRQRASGLNLGRFPLNNRVVGFKVNKVRSVINENGSVCVLEICFLLSMSVGKKTSAHTGLVQINGHSLAGK